MMFDNKDDHLILSMSRLGFAKERRLLGCCKVPYGCQAHLSSIMKVVYVQDDQGDKDDDEENPHLARSLRLLCSSRSNISRVEPGQLLNLDDRKKRDLKFRYKSKHLLKKGFTSSSFRFAGLPPCCCCWPAGGSL